MRFPALDGYSLGGFLHARADHDPRHAVVFATGGGIRAEVYRHFLSYLAGHGIASLAFDYRGIGESRPARLRGFVAGFEDWAEYDAGGAIEWMSAHYPRAHLTGIGHSIGALMIGAPDAAKTLAQLIFVCPHTGFYGDYDARVRWGVWLCWCGLGPFLRAVFGYFPASRLGFGEDLPDLIALQWAARSRPHFAFGLANGSAAREEHVLHQMQLLRLPALVISSDDDPWATETGVRRVLHVYRSLLVVRRTIGPREDYKRSIGHSGFFRRSQRDHLWPLVVDFVSRVESSLEGDRMTRHAQ